MQKSRVLYTMIMLVLVLGAITAVAASATMVLPEFRKNEELLGNTRGDRFRHGQLLVTCRTDTHTAVLAGMNFIMGLILRGCTAVGGAVKCNGLGDSSETIEEKGSWRLVLLQRPVHRWFILDLFGSQHLECATTLISFLGSYLSEITPTGRSTKVFTLSLHEKEGHEEFTEYENEKEEIKTTSFTASENEGTFGAATESVEEDTMEVKEADEIVN